MSNFPAPPSAVPSARSVVAAAYRVAGYRYPSLFLLLFLFSLLVSGCQQGGKVTLRAVSSDDRIDRYQLPTGTHVPSVSGGVFPGDSDIVGSNLRGAAVSAPRQSSASAELQAEQQAAPSRSHKVKKGETLLSIARSYGVNHKELAAANGLSNPNQIRIGQTLLIPGAGGSGDFVAGERRHIVKSGETLYSIARKYGTTVRNLTRGNRIKRADKLNIGQLLIVNAGAGKRASVKTQSSTSSSSKSSKSAGKALATAPRRERKDFLRPLNGKVIRRFGEKSFGQHNNGIDIGASAGSSVRATENGIVVYSGKALKGFGNLILVRHADGYLSAYGYNRKNLVSRGDRVKRGQTIAEVGSSGDARKPMLHFELRKSSQPVDPLKHFSKS